MGSMTQGLVDERLPGGDLVRRGLEDLAAGRESAEALLVMAAAPRLRAVGLTVPESEVQSPLHRLYELIASDDPGSAHGRYNALIGRMTSFARAAERSARAG